MKRILLATLGLAWIVAGPARAGSMATFQFTNTTGGPVSRADFAILPAGSVKPPVVGNDPVTGLPKTASPVTIDEALSSGFDPGNFSTALGTGTSVQGLRLLFGQKQAIQNGQVIFQPVFGPNGEPPRYLDDGGRVTFDLALDPAFQGVASLRSLTAGISDPIAFKRDAPPIGGNPPPSTPPSIPEPATLALWAAAGLGMLGLRRRRRSA